eukprot:3437710-Amphidinium_carterae.2
MSSFWSQAEALGLRSSRTLEPRECKKMRHVEWKVWPTSEFVTPMASVGHYRFLRTLLQEIKDVTQMSWHSAASRSQDCLQVACSDNAWAHEADLEFYDVNTAVQRLMPNATDEDKGRSPWKAVPPTLVGSGKVLIE